MIGPQLVAQRLWTRKLEIGVAIAVVVLSALLGIMAAGAAGLSAGRSPAHPCPRSTTAPRLTHVSRPSSGQWIVDDKGGMEFVGARPK